jgi:tetratricopeptide (TPR) repeat protein
MKRFRLIILLLTIITATSGCKKYLEEKPDKKLVVPERLEDLQAILDDFYLYNINEPATGEVSTPDYYLTDDDFNALPDEFSKRAYTWQKDHLFDAGINGNDWYYTFTMLYRPNLVFENISKIERNAVNARQWDNVLGQAAFLRGKSFLNALQLWSPAYDKTTAMTDLGLPLRLTTDFNIPSVRTSAEDSYKQVISDLQLAARSLPAKSVHVTIPSKAAAYALLSRAFLMMREYAAAHLYADSALTVTSTVLDFNSIDPTLPNPIPQFNSEVIFDSNLLYSTVLDRSRAKIIPELFDMYEENDLRKTIFFAENPDGSQAFRGSFSSFDGPWWGLTVGEVLLNRAECFAREGNKEEALQDLNVLLEKRYKQGTFFPYSSTTTTNILEVILRERRKELLMRSIRWMDVKRLNKEGAVISFSRTVNGQLYTLPANDLRFVLPIPEDVIASSGIIQNPR